MRMNNVDKAIRHCIQSLIPVRRAALYFWLQGAPFQRQRFAERRALGAQTPQISRVQFSTAHQRSAACIVILHGDTATYPAIGASCINFITHKTAIQLLTSSQANNIPVERFIKNSNQHFHISTHKILQTRSVFQRVALLINQLQTNLTIKQTNPGKNALPINGSIQPTK